MKNNCKRDEFNRSLSIGEQNIGAKKCDVVNGDKRYFGLYPKEEKISDLNSSYELPQEVEDNPPPDGCELGKMKGKI